MLADNRTGRFVYSVYHQVCQNRTRRSIYGYLEMRIKTEAMRLTLLEAATAVFLEHGFERALMSEISNRAGCSKGTLYSYFKSKEDLFFEAVMGCPQHEAEAVITDLVRGSP